MKQQIDVSLSPLLSVSRQNQFLEKEGGAGRNYSVHCHSPSLLPLTPTFGIPTVLSLGLKCD